MPGTVDRVMRFEWPGSTGETNPGQKRTFVWDAALIQRALTDAIWRVAEDGVTRDCLAAGCVGQDKLATPVVANLVMADGAILLSKLVNGILSADVTGRSKMADGFVTTAQLADGCVTAAKLGATYYTMPTGSISLFAGEVCPSGWLECNGAEYLIASYQNLYWVCRDVWGLPSIGTKFRVPELRGWFGRGWDHGAGADPNAATRVKPTGAQGNNVGTWQGDDVKAHTHTVKDMLYSPMYGGGSTVFYKSSIGGDSASYTTTATTGMETTAKNKSLMVIVKT